jgi:Arc/MetJ-type ribon-helix-helix transcriptional regulator
MAKKDRANVASGQYATESEVICDGLRTLMARDQAVETGGFLGLTPERERSYVWG